MKFIPLMLMFLYGCSQLNNQDYERRDSFAYYTTSGIEKFMLADIPAWLNFSEFSECRRDGHVRYINIHEFMNSFSMNYSQSMQFQYKYNRKLAKLKKTLESDVVAPPNEDSLFYQSTDEVQGGIFDFKVPEFEKIHIVDVTKAISDAAELNKLKALLKSKSFYSGHPIFLSQCFNSDAIEQFIVKNKWQDANIRVLSSEIFSVYDFRGNMNQKFFIDISKILPGKKIKVYSNSKYIRNYLNGKYTLSNF